MLQVPANYHSINAVRDICKPWIEYWGGDEWGESMLSLYHACHTSYGFSDEDCALFTSKLLENLIHQYGWMLEDGHNYGFMEFEDLECIREECRKLRFYWASGGNTTSDAAVETLDYLPGWLFEMPEEEKGIHDFEEIDAH